MIRFYNQPHKKIKKKPLKISVELVFFFERKFKKAKFATFKLINHS